MKSPVAIPPMLNITSYFVKLNYSFGPADEGGNSIHREGLTSNNQPGPSVQIPEVIQDSPNQGTKTSPIIEAKPVQHIQDVYGGCDEDSSQHKVKVEFLFMGKENKKFQD